MIVKAIPEFKVFMWKFETFYYQSYHILPYLSLMVFFMTSRVRNLHEAYPYHILPYLSFKVSFMTSWVENFHGSESDLYLSGDIYGHLDWFLSVFV